MDEETYVLDRIRYLCRQRNLSCYELAKRSGIPYSTLNTLLLKETQPSLPTPAGSATPGVVHHPVAGVVAIQLREGEDSSYET